MYDAWLLFRALCFSINLVTILINAVNLDSSYCMCLSTKMYFKWQYTLGFLHLLRNLDKKKPSEPYCDAVIFGCVDGAISFSPITYSEYCNLCADDE